MLFRKRSGCEPRLPGLGLVAAVDEVSLLGRVVHRPIDLPALVVVLADLGVEAPVDSMLEDVAREREDLDPATVRFVSVPS